MQTHWTYTRRYAAWLGSKIVTVPDQVADDQQGYAERDEAFPARTDDGETIAVKIDAEGTGLFTGGTGDLRVVPVDGRLYRITSKAGVEYGIFVGHSPAEALLAMHRDAGYGPDVVTLDPDDPSRLRFADDADADDLGPASYRQMCGDVDDWIIEEVGEE